MSFTSGSNAVIVIRNKDKAPQSRSLFACVLRLARRPLHIATADKVKVEVEDGLAAARPDIVNRTIAIFDAAFTAELGGYELRVADDFYVLGARRIDAGDVLLRNNQDMRRRLRIDVLEGEDDLIFVDLLGGNLSGDDSAEEAIFVHGESVIGKSENRKK